MTNVESLTLLGLIATLLHWLGLFSAVHVVMKGRTPQGAIAWVLSLILFPYLTLPLYWIFGRSRFHGYVMARRSEDAVLREVVQELRSHRDAFQADLAGEETRLAVLEELAKMPFTKLNDARLLVDGQATFDAIFAGIDQAQEYVLVQFFIVRDDKLGRELAARLIRKAEAGLRVYFLYDEVGCHRLPGAYLKKLRAAGIHVSAFNTTKGWPNRFQLNFRNHRKVVIVDGRAAWVGGHNVGDEYLGRDEKIGPWRDTHLELHGAVVQCAQLAFLEDWHWATHENPPLDWTPSASTVADQKALVLPTGPADTLDSCTLFFVQAIHSAKERVWIASPYFVPDDQVICALQLAALRGVDVRVLLPEKPDHLLVYLSAFSYIEETEPAGVQIYRYLPGFLHQKVIVVDDDFAAVGTANMDNRSFRLNFEITIALADRPFAAEVAAMLEQDFDRSRLVTRDDLARRSFWFRVAVRISRLMAPIQ